jgi:hypothetical protein
MTAVYIRDYFIWVAKNMVTQTHVVVLKVHKKQNIKSTNIGVCSFSLAANSVCGCEHIFKALAVFQQGWFVILPPKLSFEFPVPVRTKSIDSTRVKL